MLVTDVSIDLGSGDGGVSQESLNRADIGAVSQEIGREGMTEGMRGNFFGNASFGGVISDDALDTSRGKAQIILFKFLSLTDKQGIIHITS